MTGSQYRRPPITEAVIEIRQKDPISKRVLEKIHNRLKKSYDSSETVSAFGIQFDAKKEEKFSKMPDEFIGYKLTTKDQVDIVQIRPNLISCSRLAPYNGWDNFEPQARKNWEIWRKESKHRKIDRIGIRYLNRIDIPFGKGQKIRVEDYLTIYPNYPEPDLINGFLDYTMQIMGPFANDDIKLIINTNVVKSPLIGHLSIVLDLDLSPQGSIPEKSDLMWEMINQMRLHKNNAFEMCITDKARELFE